MAFCFPCLRVLATLIPNAQYCEDSRPRNWNSHPRYSGIEAGAPSLASLTHAEDCYPRRSGAESPNVPWNLHLMRLGGNACFNIAHIPFRIALVDCTRSACSSTASTFVSVSWLGSDTTILPSFDFFGFFAFGCFGSSSSCGLVWDTGCSNFDFFGSGNCFGWPFSLPELLKFWAGSLTFSKGFFSLLFSLAGFSFFFSFFFSETCGAGSVNGGGSTGA